MERIFLSILIAIVAIAPLPLGSNRPLGWSLLALAVGVLLFSWSVFYLWTRRALPVPIKRIRGPLILFSLACAWVLIQLIPGIPFGMAHPGWQEMNNFFGSDVPGRITIDPDWTLTIFMRWITYAGVFWLALQLGRDRAAAGFALKSFVWIGGAYALYGLVAHLSGSETILFYDKWVYAGALTSTFVNRNSYATFAGLGLIVTVALLLKGAQSNSTGSISLHERILKFLTVSLSRSSYIYLAAFLLITALLLTGSRAGSLATLLALLTVSFFFLRKKRRAGGSIAIPIALIGIVGVAVVSLSGDFLLKRLTDLAPGERQATYVQSYEVIKDHSLLGSGLGSFPQIFQLYRNDGLLGWGLWDKAHNTYLESTLELGIPAALSLHLALLWFVWICWKGVGERSRDRHIPIIGVAVSVLIALHSLVDFSLQIPAIAVAYTFLLGIAVSQSFSFRRRG